MDDKELIAEMHRRDAWYRKTYGGNETIFALAAARLTALAEENERLRGTIRNVEIHLKHTHDTDQPELLWGHVAHMLRQDGFAKGEPFDAHFTGTNLSEVPR